MINPHPGLPELEYVKPATLIEASTFLAEHVGTARPFSGGTDSLVRLRDGVLKLDFLVDVKGLEGTNELSFDPEKGLTIGAAVTMNKVAAHPDVIKNYPNLVEAIRSVASYQLRNRATIIGNICNASPAGDTIGTCMAMDGVIKVHGLDGIRDLPLNILFSLSRSNCFKTRRCCNLYYLANPSLRICWNIQKIGAKHNRGFINCRCYCSWI